MTNLLRCTTCKRVITRTEWDSFVDRRVYRCCDHMNLEPDSDETPFSVWQGSFRVFGVEVKCHVLSDGRRVVEAASMQAMLEAMGAPGENDRGEIEKLARWQKGFDAP